MESGPGSLLLGLLDLGVLLLLVLLLLDLGLLEEIRGLAVGSANEDGGEGCSMLLKCKKRELSRVMVSVGLG